ncbi:unnamed protein product [Discosporangium mesarthrocarpum]
MVEDDVRQDESVCLGAGTRPVGSSSYSSSPNLWMYRLYNGGLYNRGHGAGAVGGNSAPISRERGHPGDVFRVTLDCEAGTLSYVINGERDQGVCFTGISGEVFPAVSFYGANRSVRLLSVERARGAGPGTR